MAQEMSEAIDWDQGLPLDVLALVAKAGGLSDMQAMRSVSKSWQQGFELGVGGITLRKALPLLNFTAQRFPGLTHLDISGSTVPEAWLQSLRVFPKLNSVALGCQSFKERSKIGCLGSRLTNAGLDHLHELPALTRLGLSFRDRLTSLGPLVGMRLTALDLTICQRLTPVALVTLKTMPLTELSLDSIAFRDGQDLSMDFLRGMALESLNLFDVCRKHCGDEVGQENEYDALLEPLCGMPLKNLNLSKWPGSNLEPLRGLSLLISLDLSFTWNL